MQSNNSEILVGGLIHSICVLHLWSLSQDTMPILTLDHWGRYRLAYLPIGKLLTNTFCKFVL